VNSGKSKRKKEKNRASRKKKSAPKKSARRHFSRRPRTSSRTSRAARAAAPSHLLADATQPTGKLFENLVALQARLRAPGGCPWDRQQTHATLQTYLIEETYEVLDALQKGDPREMADELGDLLLQVLFHADLARESGSFGIADVITAVHNKMVRRHPHVFGNAKADTPEQVLKNWAQLKALEKSSASSYEASQNSALPSALDGVPRNLPAILEAYQLSGKAARVGFDWESVEGIFEKLQEECAELREVIATQDRMHQVEEVGDLLFAAVNLARFLGIDPEVALKHCNLKFKNRFVKMEAAARQVARTLDQLSTDELETLWQKSKLAAPPATQKESLS
jgi:tetrapyrrole methylase family protein/MazG family protein